MHKLSRRFPESTDDNKILGKVMECLILEALSIHMDDKRRGSGVDSMDSLKVYHA